jgi:hypothetical protein
MIVVPLSLLLGPERAPSFICSKRNVTLGIGDVA